MAALDVAAAVEPILAQPGEVTEQVEHRTSQPSITGEDVEAVLPAARRAVAGPVRLTNRGGGADLELLPAEIATVLSCAPTRTRPQAERLRSHRRRRRPPP
ncbi:MAG: hypothetical protein M3O70_00595 [Actinomycetota bacterium]|nr:hypothetical protein [Actinomycetota bacterium]